LLSTNPGALLFAVLIVAGAILYVIGTLLRRERVARVKDAQHSAQIPTEAVSDVATRIDMVERLAMVGQPWCVDQLAKIRDEDPNDSVRDAAEAALIVIASRA
jgi:hypothetical protein